MMYNESKDYSLTGMLMHITYIGETCMCNIILSDLRKILDIESILSSDFVWGTEFCPIAL